MTEGQASFGKLTKKGEVEMKRILAALVSLSLLMALTSCSQGNEQDESLGMNLDDYTIVDIAHLQEADMPADPSLQLPQSDFFGRIGVDGGLHNLEVLSYCVHTGTHMDAPYHVLDDQGGIDTVDATILIGPACVLKLDVPEGSYAITVDDVKAWEEAHGEIQEGDAVLFHTGHDALWESDPDRYISEYPYLAPETAQYMVDKGVRYIAMESISPDTTTTESHQILLGNGVGVVENVCNLGDIEADRCYTIGTFPNSQGSTGVWTRILALYR